MRMSKLYMPTLREVPSDAEIPSHRLLLRGGMIRRTSSGVYTFLPLGYRSVKKVEAIVREEMDRSGSNEVLMSILQPKEIWEQSGRWATFGPEMFKLKDRHDQEYSLGPTAEEYFVTLIRDELRSYKELPLNLYQIQWKYRDEKRPRFGINRSREFLMKDAYSFDADQEGLEKSYKIMWDAYERIFDRVGLDYRVVQGDSGAMGGNASHEFTALSEVGEGLIVYCQDCDYAATDEKAAVHLAENREDEESLQMEKVETPDCRTIEQVANYLGVDQAQTLKAVLLLVQDKPVFVFLRGDRQLNMAKLVSYLGVPEHEIDMLGEEEIEKLTGAEAGFIGPVDLSEDIRVIVDKQVTHLRNLVTGANESGFHYKNVNYDRDFKGEIADDLMMIEETDVCPSCGGKLNFARGIEVGNIFQLGTKYSDSLNASFLDEQGKATNFLMGSYGIGITRTVSAVVEQNNDDKGIVWPISVAPYEAVVTIVNVKDEDQLALGEKIYDALEEAGIDVLLDDRKERAGVKFNDRDLIGIPLRITAGKKAVEGIVEYSTRREMKNQDMDWEDAVQTVVQEVRQALGK